MLQTSQFKKKVFKTFYYI